MATIIPHNETDFNKELRDFLAKREGDVRRIYSDDKGIPTMGIGFALFHKNADGGYSYRGGSLEALRNELQTIDITLNEQDLAVLSQTLTALNSGNLAAVFLMIPKAQRIEKDGNSPISTNNSFSFTLDEEDVQVLLDLSLQEARTALRTKLGDQLYTWYEGSKEMIALQSLAFNSPKLIGAGLTTALKNDDRAEAWFEIRYHSNGDYINGNRRYYESDMFGLYNEDPSEEDFLGVYRMYTRHRDDTLYYQPGLLGYEEQWAPPSDSVSLEEAFKSAYDYLVAVYGEEDILIDYRDIQVAEDSGSVLFGTWRDGNWYNAGEEQNDLMIGSDASDVLLGGGGDDILHGLDGRDALHGGSGTNYLYGGRDNDDYFIDATGHNTAVDEQGDDTYVIHGSGGQVNITDSDGTDTYQISGGASVHIDGASTDDRVLIDGAPVVLAFREDNGENVWRSSDGKITITHNSPLTITDDQGNTIVAGNYEENIFGLHLLDRPESAGQAVLSAPDAPGTIVSVQGNRAYVQYLEEGDVAGYNPIILAEGWNSEEDYEQSFSVNIDTVHGGAGRDFIAINNSYVPQELDPRPAGLNLGIEVRAGGGNDVVSYQPSANFEGNEDAEGGFFYGESGKDVLLGGKAKDYLNGGEGHDLLLGLQGKDVLEGGESADILGGGEGDDILSGGAGDDYLYAGQGDDVLEGGDGSDRLYGDTELAVSGEERGAVDLGKWGVFEGFGMPVVAADDYLGPPQDLYLRMSYDVSAPGNDVLSGGAGDDDIFGGGGDDKLYGGLDNDQLYGEGGDDVLDGGEGNDILYGDFYHEQYALDTSIIYSDHGEYNGFNVYVTNREYVDPVDVAGNDSLFGGAGDDMLFGGGGDDILDGGEGNDYLDGGEGNDIYRIGAGGGMDALRADEGTDQVEFVGVSASDMMVLRMDEHMRITDATGAPKWCFSTVWRGLRLHCRGAIRVEPVECGHHEAHTPSMARSITRPSLQSLAGKCLRSRTPSEVGITRIGFTSLVWYG